MAGQRRSQKLKQHGFMEVIYSLFDIDNRTPLRMAFVIVIILLLARLFGPIIVAHLQEKFPTESVFLESASVKTTIADRCFIKYTLSGNDGSISINNSEESKISIGTSTGIIDNNVASCTLEWLLKSDIGERSGIHSIYPKIEKKGMTNIGYKDINEGIYTHPIYNQIIEAKIVCRDKETSTICSSDSSSLYYNFPISSYSGRFLIIDGSENINLNKDKTKPMIIDLRNTLSGVINSEMKSVNAKGLRNKYNVILFNPGRYAGQDELLKQIEGVIKKVVAKYNDIPFVIVPMTKYQYMKTVELYYINDCYNYDRRGCVAYQYSKMSTGFNVYDIRFIDAPENYNLDFRVFLASQKS